MLIRPAAEPDLPAIASIYAHEAATGIATFDPAPVPRVLGVPARERRDR